MVSRRVGPAPGATAAVDPGGEHPGLPVGCVVICQDLADAAFGAENFTHPVKRGALIGHCEDPLGGNGVAPMVRAVRGAVYDLDCHTRPCRGVEGIAPG